MSTPAGWYPDPNHTHELRYWDGDTWTEHVSDQGVTSTSALDKIDQALSFGQASPQDVAKQMARAGVAGSATGGGTLFTEPVLVVNQKAKLIELVNEYTVFDGNGRAIGKVAEVGQSKAKKVMRLVSNLDQFMTHRLEVRGADSSVQLVITRPAKLIKSTVVVSRPDGTEIGKLVQENAIGKIRFAITAGDHKYGSINAENWRAWNFSIRDHTETEVARITKTWEGLAKAAFTTADNYVVQFHQQLQEPMLSLVVAAALTVDLALKQDSN